MTHTQAKRHIAIGTPLGDDVLLLRQLRGREAMSEPFELRLDLQSERSDISFQDIVGQNVGIRLALPENRTRHFNGYVNQFELVEVGEELTEYRATVVPWLWMLTRRRNCRVFLDKTMPEILRAIFDDYEFDDVEWRLSRGYSKWEYRVQYRESDFDFVSRLMEQEGVYYHFEHEDGKHTLVLCDSKADHDPYPAYETIQLRRPGASGEGAVKEQFFQEQIWQWRVRQAVQPGRFSHTDFDFRKPAVNLLAKAAHDAGHMNGSFEQFEYPGEYAENADGDEFARLRMEELAAGIEVVSGESDARGLAVGRKFTLVDHLRRDQNQTYLVLATEFRANAGTYETEGGGDESFETTFKAIPANVQYRAPRRTPKPVVEGPQTAIITGPPGKEIFPDEFGRVKAQFHWDRYGQGDENSSCWIRVSQVHAGIGFGGIDLPRVGEEVIVSFIEGDPDRPIITGRVYNGQMMPPFDLPANANVSGYKSQTVQGGGHNEMSMNDSNNGQNIVMHGQKDMNKTIQNDDNTTVMNNQSNSVQVDRSHFVGNNESLEIGVDRNKVVGNNETTSIAVDNSVQIGGNRSIEVGGSNTEDIAASQKQSIGGDLSLSVGGTGTESVGGAKALTVGSGYQVTVAFAMNSTVGVSLTEQIGAIRHCLAGGKIIFDCGASKLSMEAGGKITLEGTEILIKAKGGAVAIKGDVVDLN